VTDDVDLDRPSIARVYDFFLGGSHNFAVDRAMAEQLLKSAPDVAEVMRANRAFLRRAVRFMIERGITQFLDVGSGIPTVGNVHEVAQAVNPDTRVVYVDIDPVAVAHSRAMLRAGRTPRSSAPTCASRTSFSPHPRWAASSTSRSRSAS
jgi:hypothetical protein